MRSYLEEKRPVRVFDEVIVKSWWVILFFLLIFFAFDQAMQRKKVELSNLENKKVAHLEERRVKEEEQKLLLLQINSQSDPAWIELTLMRCLGLVPEGERKVFFTNT